MSKAEVERNIIICGDAIDEMRKLPEECADLIFADPPYWMRTGGILHRVEGTDYDGCNDEWDKFATLEEYENFTSAWLGEARRLLKRNGSIWVIGGMQCIYVIGAAMQKIGFWLINDVVWHKKNPTPNFKGTRLNNSHETLIWAAKSQRSKYTFHYKTAMEFNTDTVNEKDYLSGTRRQLGSIWRIAVCRGEERIKNNLGKKLHSTQKPEELLCRIIAINTKIGDLVLDPFGGTMTTGAVAKKMGRDYIMIERDAGYCMAGETRLKTMVPLIADIERAVYDYKEKRVTLEEMILSGFFSLGEMFYLKDNSAHGTLIEGGKLNIEEKIVDIHTGAALAKRVSAKRINGFEHWYVERGNKLVSINDVRKAYRTHIRHP